MDSKRAGGVAIFGLVVLGIIWMLLSLMPEVISEPLASSTAGNTVQQGTNTPEEHVVVHHSMKGTVHTYSGSVEAPTPCHLLGTATSVTYSANPKVSLSLTIAPSAEICAQVVTSQNFSTTVTSSEIPTFNLTINGAPTAVTLLEG